MPLPSNESVSFEAPQRPLVPQQVLTRYGTLEQQQRWLVPLLRGDISSCFAMTEPAVASSDATNIRSSIAARCVPGVNGLGSLSDTLPTTGFRAGAARRSSRLRDDSDFLRASSVTEPCVSGRSSGLAATLPNPFPPTHRGDELELDGVKWWTTGACSPTCRLVRLVNGLTNHPDLVVCCRV